MKFQTNPELGLFINHWGCFYCSILEKVEKSTKWTRHFSNDDVVKVYKDCIASGMISPEQWKNNKPSDGCFVYNAPGVYNYAAKFLESKARCTGYKKVNKNYKPLSGEEEILCLNRKGYNGSHFVAGTNVAGILKEEIEFDPIEYGSNCAKRGFIQSKRILSIIGA